MVILFLDFWRIVFWKNMVKRMKTLQIDTIKQLLIFIDAEAKKKEKEVLSKNEFTKQN